MLQQFAWTSQKKTSRRKSYAYLDSFAMQNVSKTVFPLVPDPALKSQNNVSKNWPMFAHIIGEPNLWHILEAFYLSADEAHLKIFPKMLSDIYAYFTICLRYCTISTDSMLRALVGLQLEEPCTSQLIACIQICPGNIRTKWEKATELNLLVNKVSV